MVSAFFSHRLNGCQCKREWKNADGEVKECKTTRITASRPEPTS